MCSYVFGGVESAMAESDGNVYVLSLPSFRWIRISDGSQARIKLKCQLLGKHTMLTVGGTVPVDGRVYEPEPADCDSGQFANGLGIFDLRTHAWLTRYNATDDGDYLVSSRISDVIGGK